MHWTEAYQTDGLIYVFTLYNLKTDNHCSCSTMTIHFISHFMNTKKHESMNELLKTKPVIGDFPLQYKQNSFRWRHSFGRTHSSFWVLGSWSSVLSWTWMGPTLPQYGWQLRSIRKIALTQQEVGRAIVFLYVEQQNIHCSDSIRTLPFCAISYIFEGGWGASLKARGSL